MFQMVWTIRTLIVGAVLLLAVGGIVIAGDGTWQMGLWNAQSWQAVATALTGYALAVLAATQIDTSLHIWSEEESRHKARTKRRLC